MAQHCPPKAIRPPAPVLLAFCLTFSAGQASAQSPPATQGAQESRPGIEANADLSFSKTTGNSEGSTLGLSGLLIGRPGKFEVEMQWFGYRGRSLGTLTTESLSVTAKLSRAVSEHLSVFVQHDYFHDRFSGLGDGNFTTGGVAVVVREDDEQTLKFEASAGRNNQTGYRSQPGAGAIVSVFYRWAFSPTSDVSNDTRFLRMFSSPAGRIESYSSITVGMTSKLSLRASFALRRQQTPRPRFRSLDTTTSTSLVVRF